MNPRRRAGLVIALVLLVMFVTGTAYAHAGAMPDTLRWAPVAAPLALWLIAVGRRRAALPRTALDLPLAASLIWLGVTVIFATERRLAFEFAWPFALHIGLLYLLVDRMRRGWADAFWLALLASAGVIAVISALELMAWYFGWLGEPGWFPVARAGGGPVPPLLPTLDLALNISTIQGNTVAVLLPLTATGALVASRRSARLSLMLLAGALLVIEFFTFSRGGLLGAFAAAGVLCTFAVLRWSGKTGHLRGLLQPRLVLGAMLIGALGLSLLMVVWSARQRSASDQGRLDTWRSAVEMARDHPATGVGPGLFGRTLRAYRDPELAQDKLVSAHNLPLNVLAETGVPGLLLLAWITALFLRAWWRAWRQADLRRRRWLEGALAALVAYAVHSLVDTFPLTSSLVPVLVTVAYTLAEPRPARAPGPLWQSGIAWGAVGVMAVYGAAFAAFDIAQGWMLASRHAVERGDLDTALIRARRAQMWDSSLSLYDWQEAYVLGLLAVERPSQYLGAAINAHRRALAHEPTFDRGWANLAGLYAQGGGQLPALEAMRRAAAINPQMAVYWWWLGDGMRAIRENPDLAEYVRRRDPAGLRDFLADSETSAGLRLYVALLAGQTDTAADLVPVAEREESWMAHLALGMYAQRVLHDPGRARAWLDRAVVARPQDERPALVRAELALAAGDLDAAEADARRALFADRYGGAKGYAILAEVERARGAGDARVIGLLRASVAPRPEPDYFVGTVYARPAAFDLLPQLAVPGMASEFYTGWFVLAELYVAQGDAAQARAVYRELLELNPHLTTAAEALSALSQDDD